jgi:cytochrome c
MDGLPIPRDFPLPMPASNIDLQVLIVVLFLAHLLFVNLMVGGSLLTVAYEIRGLRRPKFDALARRIASTVTVNKSVAVVLGVGPLLVMNALYALWFYTANALTGRAWLLVVPLVIMAFLLLYAHKYSWDVLMERKGLHISIAAAATALLLAVPLIFLANINLMLFPERWLQVKGFFSTLLLANVVPRYLHFVLASLAVTALFLAGWLCRRGFDFEAALPELDRCETRRELLAVAFGATGLQLVAGPLVLLTLPPHGLSWLMIGNIAAGLTLALIGLGLLWREMHADGPLSARYWKVVVVLGCTVGFMLLGRHVYREQAIENHRAMVAAHTADFHAAAVGAEMRLAAGAPRISGVEASVSPGERVFRGVCMACHAREERRVGPPLTEIFDLYQGNAEGLIAWVRAPGKRRPDYPQMPPIAMQEGQYRAIADYILEDVFAPESTGDVEEAGQTAS